MAVLETNVPDIYVQKVIDMLDLFSDETVGIRVGRVGSHMSKNFQFEGIKPGESQIDLAERFIKEFMLTGLRMAEQRKAYVAKMEAIKAIDITEADVPDGTIT